MNLERLREKREEYHRAVLRLKEVLEADVSNPFVYDAAIQRFEFTYELAWKLMKAYLEYDGIAVVNSPRSAFKEAFAAGLIHDGDGWMAMLDDRNLTTHTYDEQKAMEIYERIKGKYYARFVDFADGMAEALK